jgi:hypothetical protein
MSTPSRNSNAPAVMPRPPEKNLTRARGSPRPAQQSCSSDAPATGEELDQRLQEGGGELVDQPGEGGADDDADPEVDDVAAQDEVAKALEHCLSKYVIPPTVREDTRG